MKRFGWILCILAVVTFSVSMSVARAQGSGQPEGDPKPGEGAAAQPPSGQQPGMADMAEMMKKWKALASPSEHHKALEPFVGKWNTTMKMWMGGPMMPPTETKGTSEVKWVLGGRFLLEEYEGELLMPDATMQMSKVMMSGLGMLGFDNARNMYVGTWADSNGTHLLTFTGTLDPPGKVLTCYGVMDEALISVYGRMVKYVTRILDNDKHVFELYDLHAGEDYKVVEVVYERQGSAPAASGSAPQKREQAK